jgi:DNA helicase-2/ATP-dependent DNA helicase PcrA
MSDVTEDSKTSLARRIAELRAKTQEEKSVPSRPEAIATSTTVQSIAEPTAGPIAEPIAQPTSVSTVQSPLSAIDKAPRGRYPQPKKKEPHTFTPRRIELTPEQAEAASYHNGSRLIVATAGSGKTTTMAERIASLMRDHKIYDGSILATTFTKAAARELKERIDLFTGRETSIMAGTMHSYCMLLIMRNHQYIGFDQPPTILGDKEQKTLLTQVMMQVTGVGSLKELTQFSLNDVYRWMMELDVREYSKDPRDRDPMCEGEPKTAIASICRIYRKRMMDYGYLDYDAILSMALRLLINHGEEIKEFLPKHVFVDEAQDLSAIQWMIIEQLKKHALSIDVIGDDDQSIYRWRQALPWRFRDFSTKVDKLYRLSSNRRCGSEIVKLAEMVVAEIPSSRRIEKSLKSAREDKGSVRFTALPAFSNLFLVARKIAEEVAKGQKKFKDFAFIVRSTTRIFPTMEGILRLGVEPRDIGFTPQQLGLSPGQKFTLPYQILGGKSALDSPEARMVRNLGSLLAVRAGAKEPLIYWLSVISDLGISAGAAKTLLDIVASSGAGSISVIEGALDTSKISSANKAKIRKVSGALRVTRLQKPTIGSIFENDSLRSSVEHVIREAAIRDIENKRKESGGITDNAMAVMIESTYNTRYETLMSVISPYLEMPLHEALLSIDGEEMKKKVEDDNVITLTTCHSSKGLEWDTVFILEANSSNWPSAMAFKGYTGAPKELLDEIKDEERRLLYVAVTRAKNSLYVMTTTRNEIDYHEHQPSSFLPIPFVNRAKETIEKAINNNKTVGELIDVEKVFEENDKIKKVQEEKRRASREAAAAQLGRDKKPQVPPATEEAKIDQKDKPSE